MITCDLLESSLELLGDGAVEGGLLHDLADQPLLAVQVVVVELLVDILEHGDPGDDVQAIEESLVVGPIILHIRKKWISNTSSIFHHL